MHLFIVTEHSFIIVRAFNFNLFTGADKLGTDESAFNSILATRSWAHLRQVMVEYEAMFGHSLEKAVKSEFSANAEKALNGICKKSIILLMYHFLQLNYLQNKLKQCSVPKVGLDISPNASTAL